MKRISSSTTAFSKKAIPLYWLAFLGLFVFIIVSNASDVKGIVVVLLVACAACVVGYSVMKKTVWDLADEVYDDGDSLLIRKSGQEQRIPLTDIAGVDWAKNSYLRRITLKLNAESAGGPLGSEIAFSPEVEHSKNPLIKPRSRVAEDLIHRIEQAKSKRA